MTKSKVFKFLLILLIASLLVASVVACKSEAKIVSVSMQGPSEFKAGEFAYENYTLTVNYDNGESQQVPLSQDFLDAQSQKNLSTKGTHTLNITYQGVSTTFDINVLGLTMDGVVFKDKSFTYDGKQKSLAVEGLPDGAIVIYENNTHTDAGVYEVTAFVTKSGYDSLELKATLTINKANYNISSIAFDSLYTTFTGATFSLEISGRLPKGLTVSYTNNNKSAPGYYEVVANFSGDYNNYNYIEPMTAVLVISDINYKLSSDGTYYVANKYIGFGYETYISPVYQGLPVKELGANLYKGQRFLSSVTIPEGVEIVGEYAFADCKTLTTINLPASLTAIAQNAFDGCSSLSQINIAEGCAFKMDGNNLVDKDGNIIFTLPQ